ncbi:MAG: hypothetical protein KKH34_09855 [Candidatus Omnitrophica bacterium]|nr:hypothetical protein [Candidatus Omnitrophota bacterium]MCG2703019.1 hypothetical protein [Candidatus Omnitrophota bacterium]
MRKKMLNNKGLSLVEVIMSTLALAMLMAGLFGVYTNATNIINLAFHKTLALCWAESEIERNKCCIDPTTFIDPAATAPLVPFSPLSNWLQRNKAGGVNVETINFAGVDNLRVTVSWTE